MLTREQRLPVVVSLREDGQHTYKAIGKALGISESQAHADYQFSRAGELTSKEPTRILGLDGKTYPAAKPKPEPANGRRGYRKAKDAPFVIRRGARAARGAGGRGASGGGRSPRRANGQMFGVRISHRCRFRHRV